MKRLYGYENDKIDERMDAVNNVLDSNPDISDVEALGLFGFDEDVDPDTVTMADIVKVFFTDWYDFPEKLWTKPLLLYTEEEQQQLMNLTKEVVSFVRE